jgi:membrane protease YdiL (CAAX protease family)
MAASIPDRTNKQSPTPAATRVWPIVGVYLLVTWLAAGGLYLAQTALAMPGDVLVLTQFAPSLAVLVVLVSRRARIVRRSVSVAAIAIRTAIAVALVIALFGGCLGAFAVAGLPLRWIDPATLSHPLWLITVGQLVGACAEELGWRTFLQQYLAQRYSTLVSGVLVGAFWGTWHVEYFGYGALFMTVFLVAAMALSVTLAILVRNTGLGSLLIAGAFHWLLNLGVFLLLDFEGGSLRNVAVLAGGAVVTAATVWQIQARRHRR